MQNILLINLMRMGDVLQMTTVIEALRASYPQARIVLIMNESFLAVGRRIDADEVIPFAIHALQDMLLQEGCHFHAYGCLKTFMETVEGKGPFDLIFNLTPSPSAAGMSAMLPHTSKRGMWIESDGSFQAADAWAAYLVAMMSNRRTNPFHLVDIWLRSVEQHGPRRLQMKLYPDEIENIEGRLTAAGVDLDQELLIGFQVSASQKEKCWSEKEFIRLGQSLKQGLKARVLLFGVAAEQELCERIGTQIPGSVSLAGKTSLGELAAALRRCRVLITNDTGTQHVATTVGTPVIVISVGPVFFRETGPYGEGHLIFQARPPCAPCSFNVSCLRPVCKEMVRSEQIYSGVVHLLRGEEGTPQGLPDDVACYRSGFDKDGMLEFSLMNLTPEDRKLEIYKSLWLTLLEKKPLHLDPSLKEYLDFDIRAGWSQLETALRGAAKLIGQIHAMGSAGASDPSRLKVFSENLKTAEQEMKRIALETTDLAPFVTYLLIRRESLSFQDPLCFLRETASLYNFMAEQMAHGLKNTSPRKEAIGYGNH